MTENYTTLPLIYEDTPCMEIKSPEEVTGDIESLKLRLSRLESFFESIQDDGK